MKAQNLPYKTEGRKNLPQPFLTEGQCYAAY